LSSILVNRPGDALVTKVEGENMTGLELRLNDGLLHVFRNTPLGRESMLQSAHFCKTLSVSLHVYVPESKQFKMYFEHDIVQVDLDGSYLASPSTAEEHARQLAETYGIKPNFFTPKNYGASQLPDIPTHFTYMCCPRSISDLSSKIGLGFIGPKVRRIIKLSAFPVLLTGGIFKEWRSITVFYGGTCNNNKSLRWGVYLSELSGMPLDLFTYGEHRGDYECYETEIKNKDLWDPTQQKLRAWHRIDQGSFEEGLYAIDHDSLLIVGACGHGLIKDILFGSKMETIQSWMPNNMLLIGPNCIL
jgi:hypothetical protein